MRASCCDIFRARKKIHWRRSTRSDCFHPGWLFPLFCSFSFSLIELFSFVTLSSMKIFTFSPCRFFIFVHLNLWFSSRFPLGFSFRTSSHMSRRQTANEKNKLKQPTTNQQDEQRYCICQKREDEFTEQDNNDFMIECDGCNGWFHGRCVALADRIAGLLIFVSTRRKWKFSFSRRHRKIFL